MDSLYVEELGGILSKDDLYNILVIDIMEGAIEVDWRDFFPYLKWIPNRKMEMKIHRMYSRREAVMKALINEQKKRIASGKVNLSCTYMTANIKFWAINCDGVCANSFHGDSIGFKLLH